MKYPNWRETKMRVPQTPMFDKHRGGDYSAAIAVCSVEVTYGRQYEIKKSSNGQFFFNLKAGNGEKILTSEMYMAKSSAEGGIESVRKNAPTDSRYERKTTTGGPS